MFLSTKALGLSLGIVTGLAVLLATWWLVIIGSAGATVAKFHKFFPGYTVSWGGGIIGGIWGFVYGFIAGFLLAWIYNAVNKKSGKDNE